MMEGVTNVRGDELLARVLSGDEWGSGVANDLLNEFFRGYPIEKLSTLLHSDNEQVLQSGAWIASELAQDARPVLGDLVTLFDSPNVRVKYYAIETVVTAATQRDGEVAARAASLIGDPELPVRRASFQLLARADTAVLAASLPYVVDRQIAAPLAWALEVDSESRDSDEITSRLQEPDELGQRFAVIAAARVYRRNPHYLQHAASLDESDAQSLAASELEWLSKLQEQSRRRNERAERRDG
jgi:hypothetical protein